MSVDLISENKVFGGWHRRYQHSSNLLKCDMKFAVFIPEIEPQDKNYPVIYWLSGLTCTDENFMQKSGALKIAADLGLVLITPDTSPRGDNIPDDANNAYDFGKGAGFYVNATEEPWNANYQMYDYIVDELPYVINNLKLPISSEKTSICGHSMGGHGALVIALRNPSVYKSVSALSPICNPCKSSWGEKAFSNYLGNNIKLWEQYDTCELIKQNKAAKLPVLVDQGDKDEFLADQLHTEALKKVAKEANYPITINIQLGYDHSYYFIATFIEKHLQFHNKFLQ